jgi:carbamate kinase
MIGFLLEQALRNALPDRTVATLLTSVLVAPGDPAFEKPAKFVGPSYTAEQAREAAARGWTLALDGDRLRRVVPSPEPCSVLELEAVRVLVEAGVLVICGGGGGVPVVRHAGGRLQGVEGVVDKDLTSALLAQSLQADRLLMLTDVAAVEADWGTPRARPIGATTPRELRAMTFAAGSMGPKVEAACRFVERTGGVAAIGALQDAAPLLSGSRGTIIRPDPS